MHQNLQKFLQKAIPIPQRWILSIMGLFAIVNGYTLRNCLSITITEMVLKIKQNDTLVGVDYCEVPDNNSDSDYDYSDTSKFQWDEELQGLILSSFYWGYLLTHIPGGMLSEKFGGKYVLSLGLLLSSVLTLLIPVAVDSGGSSALIAIRFFVGFGEGTMFPSLNALLAMWVPLGERSIMGTLVFGGAQFGTIFGTLISGFLIDSFDDWRPVFYFFGILGILWFAFFTLLCYSQPDSHPYITEDEKDHLRKELGQLGRDKSLPPTPWKAILSNAPMIALIFAQVGHSFGYFIMATDLPKYMSDVLHFNIKENGLYSSLPYLLMWIISVAAGLLGDWLIRRKILGITVSRKLFTTIASFCPSLLILGASYAECNRVLVVVLFTLSMGTMGTFYPGFKVNAIDLSPNYSGSLMGITNGLGAITGMVGPYMVGVMTPNRTINEWRNVFWIAFAVFNFTNIVYLIWASGNTQAFNNPNAVESSNTKTDSEENDESKSNRNSFKHS